MKRLATWLFGLLMIFAGAGAWVAFYFTWHHRVLCTHPESCDHWDWLNGLVRFGLFGSLLLVFGLVVLLVELGGPDE